MKTTALLFTLVFGSCVTFPATVKIQGNYGTYGYSTKRGLEIEVNATK